MNFKNAVKHISANTIEVFLTKGKTMVCDNNHRSRYLLKNHRWYCSNGYAASNMSKNANYFSNYTKQKLILFHAEYVGFKDADHISRDKLDNRDENLREATRSLQLFNRETFKNNTSGSRGIGHVVNKYKKKDGSISQTHYWRVQISNDGKSQYKFFSYDARGMLGAKYWRFLKELELYGEAHVYADKPHDYTG